MAIAILPHGSSISVAGPSFGRYIRRSTMANLKQQRRGTEAERTFSSPILTAEVLASRLGLEMAVAGLERIFHQPGDDPPASAGTSSRRPIRVAYQGVLGSYCHEAAAVSFPSAAAVEAFPCGARMDAAFSALEDGSADRAVVPAENSLDGPIVRNLDLLLRYPAVRICGELVVPVNHCLLAAPGADLADLRRVVSHPQALRHCDRRIESLDLYVEEVADAAEAARAVAEDGIRDTAVIGSRMAAKEFGLRVLEPNFQDDAGNYTRFLQLSMSAGTASGNVVPGGGARKTTVAFSLEKGVSDLCRAMSFFENRGVPVTRVDHRPNRANPVRFENRTGLGSVVQMDYVFLVDVEGSESDRAVAAAVARLEETAVFVRVLGSYGSTCCSSG
ncbi:Arogenate dehydratase/prephenate dehydratase 2, chloroplastic [Apostasia shenzhenica]|uniref:Arogenate dehydratase/prephenate dehydratase 2, chloroplastic n=1 Tax=Apostasia shenzhenica TaxID=1088818 RepID=A0A2I0A7I9_9ASPA|nr:Arogenate dehydratase/prephenate dehydratase 2, chloroplastic [Apostasia shenzhenica]